MYALNLEKETGRVLSVTYAKYATEGMTMAEILPEGDITAYLFADGRYVYSPLAEAGGTEAPTQLDRIEAQLMYTAMMTDTMLEV